MSARVGRTGGAGGVACDAGADAARWTGEAGVGAWAGPGPGLDASPRTGMGSGAARLGGTGRCTAGAGAAGVAGAAGADAGAA
ncbi:hypothetical protein [Streptomyces sp. NPDC001828]|uniref:hypothetical protein n=1 Tax=Streptomyces sp. NPDC001828 TaxID=3364615 RepID=UPI0036B68C47